MASRCVSPVTITTPSILREGDEVIVIRVRHAQRRRLDGIVDDLRPFAQELRELRRTSLA